jgi:virginiamycin B lyase
LAALTVVFALLLNVGGGASVGGRSGVVSRATASGVFTEYAIPLPCIPGGITTGPDGALWFTEFRSEGEGVPTVFGTIGRVTTSGAFKEQTVSSARISEITTGPDGALWFTEDSHTRRVRHLGVTSSA